MNSIKGRYGMGVIPDYPDFRDYTEKTEEAKSVLGPPGLNKTKGLPPSVDMKEWCSSEFRRKTIGHTPTMKKSLLKNPLPSDHEILQI